MWLRRLLIPLLVAALGLPIVLVLQLAAARLLAALGDPAAAGVLDWIALAVGLLWAADLVTLVIVQGVLGLAMLPDDFEIEHAIEPFESDEPS